MCRHRLLHTGFYGTGFMTWLARVRPENLSHDQIPGGAGEGDDSNQGDGAGASEDGVGTFKVKFHSQEKKRLVMTKNLDECGLMQDRLTAGNVCAQRPRGALPAPFCMTF